MDGYSTQSPVAFIIFNRPYAARKVFEAIRAARPPKLLIIADGPRAHKPGEADLCRETRAVIDGVDWPCEVLTNFSEANLGCKQRVASGLDWVFETVERAIILEDDCVPHPTFFRFCDEMLEKYADDTRMMAVTGNNYQFGQRRNDDSYYFSILFHCWGWATWRRAWKLFDIEMKKWPAVRDGDWLMDLWGQKEAADYWRRTFNRTYEERVNSWAYRMQFACFINSGLCITPNVNMVANVGFDDNATHTTQKGHILENLPAEPLAFPLRHPGFVLRNRVADEYAQINAVHGKPPKIKVILGPVYPAVRVMLWPLLRIYLRRKYGEAEL